jgi:histidine triad (HIT) family protein
MYNHAPPDYKCPFCRIVSGEWDERDYSTEADVVCRTATVTALVSSHQWPGNEPNIIIVPNEHFENIYDLPVACAGEIHALAREIALALKAIFACQGVSTRQHNEPAGSQEVWHYHLHVTPRHLGDAFYSRIPQKRLMPAGDRAVYAERLRAHLAPRRAALVAGDADGFSTD